MLPFHLRNQSGDFSLPIEFFQMQCNIKDILCPLKKAKLKEKNNTSIIPQKLKKKMEKFQLSLSRSWDALKSKDWWKSYSWGSKSNVTFKGFFSFRFTKRHLFFWYISVTRTIVSRKFLNKNVQTIRKLMLNISKALWENSHTCLFKGNVKVLESECCLFSGRHIFILQKLCVRDKKAFLFWHRVSILGLY